MTDPLLRPSPSGPPRAPRYPSTQAAHDANGAWYADEYRRLWHEVERMRPVVESAEAYKDGAQCLCDVPVGALHSKECYRDYVLVKARIQDERLQLIREAHQRIVVNAIELVDCLSDDNYRPDNFTWQPLITAVDAYREAVND